MSCKFSVALWLAFLLPLVPVQARSTTVTQPGPSINVRVYLNPHTGRFWTMDSHEGNSSDPSSLHKYLYCHANPVNGWDPSGHDFSMTSMMSSVALRSFVMNGVSGAIINSVGGALIFHETKGSEFAWNANTGFLLGGLGPVTKIGGNILVAKFGLQGVGKIGIGLGWVGINAIAATAETVAKEKFLNGNDVSNKRIAELLAANLVIGCAFSSIEAGLDEASKSAQKALKELEDYKGNGWPRSEAAAPVGA